MKIEAFQIASDREAAVLLTLTLGATPLFFDYSHRLMSEIPFLAASTLALLAMVEISSDGLSNRGMIGWGILLTLSISAAVLIRGNGLAFAPALLVGLLGAKGGIRRVRRYILGAALAVMLLVFAVWTIRCNRVEFQGINNVTYLQEVRARDIGELWNAGGYRPGIEQIGIRECLGRCFKNVTWYQAYRTADLFVPSSLKLSDVKMPGLGLTLATLLLFPVMVGFVILWRRSPPCAVYLLGTLGICIAYPTGGAARMLLPSIPLLIVAGYLGLACILGETRAWGWFATLLVVNIVVCTWESDCQARHPYSRNGFGDYIDVLAYDIPAMNQSEQVLVPSLSTSSPYWEAACALTNNRVMTVQDAMTKLSEGEIEALLLIEQTSTESELQKAPTSGFVDEILSHRSDLRLLRRTRQKIVKT